MDSLVSKALKNIEIEGRIDRRYSLIVINHILFSFLIFCFLSSLIVEYFNLNGGHRDLTVDYRWSFFVGIIFQVFVFYLLKNNIKRIKSKLIKFN